MVETAGKPAASRKATRKSSPRSRTARPSGTRSAPGRAGKKLVIVESPAKARTINRYLGEEFVVRASMGHVRDLPGKDLGVDLEHDFRPRYEPLPGRMKVLTELKKYARSAPEVYLATDLDREGEAIAWHLAELLGVPEQRLKRVIFNEITRQAIRQAFAHPGGIDLNKVNAQQARRILDRIVGYQVSPLLWRKVAAGLSAGRVQTVAVRLIVEREREIQAFAPREFWRIAAILTPQVARAAGVEDPWRRFLAETDQAGQPPTQARQMEWLTEQEAFRAELVQWKDQPFAAEDAAAAREAAEALGLLVESVRTQDDPSGRGPVASRVTVVGRVRRSGQDVQAPDGSTVRYLVRSVQSRPSQNRPPAPFTTASMQQAAAVQLRFSASRTMRLAQQLYEGVALPGEGSVGLITYMRTDSTNLSAQAVGQVRDYVGQAFGPDYLPEKPNVWRAGPRAQAAHEAVRPTDVTRDPKSLREALEGDQWRLYDLIWRRFVACQMAPARWNVTEVAVTAGTPAGEGLFKAVGRQMVFEGYLKVAGRQRAEDQHLPDLTAEQAVGLAALEPTQHFTQPPPRYTEASLVKALEAEGIGRPSTYAAIIQTIQERGYVGQIERRFHATELGMKVTDKLVGHFSDIFDLRFTARMEDQLDDVEEGRTDWRDVLRGFYGPFKADLERAAEEMVHAKAETEPSEYTCPNCHKPMVYRWSKNGRYLACTGYPECKTTFPVDADGRKMEPVEVDVACPVCQKPKMILRRSRYGPFLGCGDYPNCKGTLPCDKEGRPLKIVKPEDIRQTCPECGATMEVRRRGRRAFLGCSRYPDCKTTKPLPEGVRLEAPPRSPPVEAGVACPKCGKPMLIRTGRRGKFVSCSGYPRCRTTFDISDLEALRQGEVPARPPRAQRRHRAGKSPGEGDLGSSAEGNAKSAGF